MWKNILPDETIARIYETWKNFPEETDPNQEFGFEEVEGSPSQAAFEASKAKRIEETHPGMSVEEYDALTKAFRDRTSTRMFGPEDIFPHEVALETEGAELQQGDPTLSSQEAVELPSRGDTADNIVPATNDAEVDTIAIDKLLKQLGASDPNALSTTLPELPTTAEISPATLEKQQAYLDALKKASSGYGQDKWMALADWGRATMAETPQYQGESIMSIAARTGEKPLAALQAAQKEEKAANLGYLKAELDTEINNEAFKTKAEQLRFTNILALKAADATIRNSDAAWWTARHPKGSISRKITDDDVEMSVSFLEQLIPQGAKSEKLLAKVQALNPKIDSLDNLEGYLGRLAADNNVANIIAHETESFKQNYLRDNRVNAKKEDIDGNNIMVLLDIIEKNPELADGWMLTRALDSVF